MSLAWNLLCVVVVFVVVFCFITLCAVETAGIVLSVLPLSAADCFSLSIRKKYVAITNTVFMKWFTYHATKQR